MQSRSFLKNKLFPAQKNITIKQNKEILSDDAKIKNMVRILPKWIEKSDEINEYKVTETKAINRSSKT